MRKWITGLFLGQPTPKPAARPVADNDPDDEDIQQIISVQRICQIGEIYIEGQDGSGSEEDLYEREQFEAQIKRALSIANEITDEFCLSSAMHFISTLMAKAGQFDRATQAIEFIEVDFIREKALENLRTAKRQRLSSV